MAHFELASLEHTALTKDAVRDLIRGFGSEEEFAENIRVAESDTSLRRDPSCRRAITWTLEIGALGWLIMHSALLIVGLAVGPEFLDRVMPLGRVALWLLPAASAAIGYRLMQRIKGNPHRILPFLHAALVLFVAMLLVRCEPRVVEKWPLGKWHIFVGLQFPMPDISAGGMYLSSAILDLDFTGGQLLCRPQVLVSTVATPLQAISSARFSLLFLLTWTAALLAIQRGNRHAHP